MTRIAENAVSDHAEHDRADKRDGDIGGDDAQFADESHGKTSLVHAAVRTNADKQRTVPAGKKSALLHCLRYAALLNLILGRSQRG